MRARRGFTLIEASMTTMIIGVAFVAVMQLFAACTQQNRVGENLTTAMLLAENIQETMAGLPFDDPAYGASSFGPEAGQTLAGFDDVDDFDGLVCSPPIDSFRRPIPAMSQFTQSVSVLPVYPTQLSSNSDLSSSEIPKGTYTGAVRVTVRIMYADAGDTPVEIFRTSWIRVDR